MMQILYRILYSPFINLIARNLNKGLHKVFPTIFKLPPSGIIRLSSKEVSVKIATNQSNFLTKEVFWEGFEHFEYTKIFISLSKKVNSFYDIGANIGYFSILAGKANSNIEIHAFEPSKGPLYFLRKNCDLNNLNNVTISSLALSDRIGKITFYEIQNVKYTYLKHNLAGESNTGSKTSGRNYMPIEVDTIRLDDYYLNSGSKNKIDLIKIDTEGTEDVILENAHEILTNHRPIIICETLFGMIEDKLDALMTKYDYEFFNHTEKGLEKVSTIVRSKDNGVINCFFVHPSKAHLIEEYISKN